MYTYIHKYLRARCRLSLGRKYISHLAYSDYYYYIPILLLFFFLLLLFCFFPDSLAEKFRGDTISIRMHIIYMSAIVPIVFVHVYPKSFEQIVVFGANKRNEHTMYDWLVGAAVQYNKASLEEKSFSLFIIWWSSLSPDSKIKIEYSLNKIYIK